MWHLPATIVAGRSLATPRACGRWLLFRLLIWLLDPAAGTVMVRLAPRGTQNGPLATPFGVPPRPESDTRAAHRHLADRGRQDPDVGPSDQPPGQVRDEPIS